jgi:hypothetical protein
VPYLRIEAIDLLAFLTAVSAGVCLVPPFVSVFEFSHMLSLLPQQYLQVQRTQKATFLFFRTAVPTGFLLTLAYALAVGRTSAAFPLSVAACLCLAAAGFISWIVSRQVTAATIDWTLVPENFEATRRRWEHTQVAAAVFTFVAFVTVLLSIAARDS